MLAHRDEVEGRRHDVGPMHLVRVDLGRAAGSRGIGVARVLLDPGSHSSAVHVHGDEEEIFYVLAGSGLSWQDGQTYEVGPGDCIVHPVAAEKHTMIAGPHGLDVLAYGERTSATATYLPRPGVVSLRLGFTVGSVVEQHPWEAEAGAGELELPEPSERPANIVNLDAAEAQFGGAVRALGASAGSIRTGLNHTQLEPGGMGAPPHCHSADEEIFVVLDGSGTLLLMPSPQRAMRGRESEEIPVRAGHVVSRPPATGMAHAFRAGPDGLTYLAYGTREPNDICYYPRSNKLSFRGIGLIARLENLDYFEGESDD